MKTALTNTHVFTGEEWLEAATVIINGRIIEAVGTSIDIPDDVDCVRNLNGEKLVPGFIDVQVNGGGGVMFNQDTSLAGLRSIAQAHRRYGTTGMLPTLITDDRPVMEAAVTAMQEALDNNEPGILGIHLEGPYLNRVRKGVHQEDKIRSMETDALDLLSRLTAGKTLVTLAPEKNTSGIIRQLVERGVLVAAGHTAGVYDDYQAAFSEGLSCFTHLFNAMTPMESREPGAVGAALDNDDSWCGLIVDGYHVHPATLRSAIKAKKRGKMMLVTDAMATVGSDQDFFELYGQKIYSREGRCTTAEGVLAGAHLDMATAVRNSVELLSLSHDEALRMASLYPAEFLGLGNELGRIEKGYRASMVLLDDAGLVLDTWIDGRDTGMDGLDI
ncbi:N-acetylglucosamine 6-phosphate deacetylase [Kiloniella litopenaei]|uniref:N-acetylglucosamine 6-phosphate deacetylase n=1 Tax=Kiloniella litopenaei TaxID=1549748 RepID=A0A0M2R6B1_9PROT|nr:N-acetylglucosamine-6-phosphate deacetylase [Kiloniella litopenaei]KKJ77432.1 N-acetylglucosamine 6-phosphate deacetylase [Kiloniella litopenaei]